MRSTNGPCAEQGQESHHEKDDLDKDCGNVSGMITSMTELFNFKEDALGSDDDDELEEYASDVDSEETITLQSCSACSQFCSKQEANEKKAQKNGLSVTTPNCEKHTIVSLAEEEDLNDLSDSEDEKASTTLAVSHI